ncbi:patatin-like phospholipase family protein [Thalassospira xiamenensis]|uniref:NTE family protein n=1 Tax=Thalassospira xiamenensis TaxID=220697 RepID=A0A285TY35_9PROT|nr:patatin-like phospholipase family protein [Thalassospira xiamenensis]SOC31079.1 NTE family protein [Thalassospira xiamenensis]
MTQSDSKDGGLQIGLALSGGGSRAAAFHLGCLRALNDRGLLTRVRIISTVSGGSLIGAMWAYSDDSFEDFDNRIRLLLLRGLKGGILRYTLMSSETPKIFATLITSNILALSASGLGLILTGLALSGVNYVWLQKLRKLLKAPLPRWASRTTAFAKFLEREVLGASKVQDVRRDRVQVIINATELRTQSAFRYGSKESGCWRFGKLDEEISVATAVASSASFPALLPAFDQTRRFTKNGEISAHRTLISDGGIYDNIGTSCLVPGRDGSISTNVTEVDFIVACVAGHGIPDGANLPYFWPGRMLATVDTIHRRTHSMTFELLHRLKDSGTIKGFLLPYLGQNDDALPCPPPDLVPRSATFGYPTDFNSMTEESFKLIAMRGEQLTRNLIETYYPHL